MLKTELSCVQVTPAALTTEFKSYSLVSYTLQTIKHDIYNSDKVLQSRLRLLAKDKNVLAINKQNITDFQLYLASEVGIERRAKYVWHLHEIAKLLDKQFTDCTEYDIRKLVTVIEANPNWQAWTQHGFRTALKRFFRWVRQYPRGEDPPETKWIKLKRPKGRKLPEELVTQEEIKSLVEVCAENIRDKAFIFTLYESGCRPGEILGLRRKHVVFDEYGTVLLVDGKTGPRRVRIVAATPLLANWINEGHPFKDPESYLWINLEGPNYGKALKYHAARHLVKRRSEQARINKRIYPYLFRHSRATELANILTEAQMNEHCGWVQGSRMPSVYVHLSGKNIDPAILQAYGLKPKQNKEFEKLKPKECHICKTVNSPIGEFCIRCGRPLDLEVAIKLDKEGHKQAAKIDRLEKQMELITQCLAENKKLYVYRRNRSFNTTANVGMNSARSVFDNDDGFLVMVDTGYRSNKKNFDSNDPHKVHEYCH